ncbi:MULTISPECIES: PLP-dependent aminotransferase family protein [unclassified Streptomyces]|uniref:MocR-like pyridoxine biosynthesis transcription factor PdxR n=1 Tax=unclassified Streptomyces TaxID=2593676 RepID=UPI0033FA7323
MNRSIGSPPDRSITAPPVAAASDWLQLNTADAPRGGLSDWLARRIRAAIADGRLPAGSRLPATRTLAGDLRVSRGVVTEAYRRLTEDGHVAGRGRAGTVVVAVPRAAAARGVRGGSTSVRGRGDGESSGLRGLFTSSPEDLGVFDAVRAVPARIDLSPGLPDLSAFPRAAWLRAERSVLAGLTPTDFGYGDPRGTPALRGAVARWLSRSRGVRCDPEDVLIVNGTAQALRLLVDVLRAEGITRVAVEEPGSLGVRQHLRPLETPPVPVDAQGVRVDALRASGAPAVLLTPAHQFPTGVVLGGERRRELMEWARDGGLVIEDDYDAEHRYDRPAVPALRALLPDQVCYAGSVSKLLAPALRLGWLLAPPAYRDALVDAKRLIDLGTAALPQLALAHLMDSGDLERHLRLVRRHHRRRRDAMIEAIGKRLPGAVVHGAAAGLHLTITWDPYAYEGGDTALATAALHHGVKTHPLSWHTQLPHAPGLVLGYAASGTAEIAEGVGVLGDLLAGGGRARGGRRGRGLGS